ncbi:hypothetical protein IC582_029780 [Cucumis melo]
MSGYKEGDFFADPGILLKVHQNSAFSYTSVTLSYSSILNEKLFLLSPTSALSLLASSESLSLRYASTAAKALFRLKRSPTNS